jgi:hypothetical protein
MCVVMAAGCARGPNVPAGAKLLYYGGTDFNIPIDDLPSGTFYVVEEESGRTMLAIYRQQGRPINFSGFKEGRHYRVYFVPGEAPTSRPSPGGGK